MAPVKTFLSQFEDRMASARDIPSLTQIVSQATRELVGADGATVVLRAQDMCHYVDENSISPLWKGRKFPVTTCISGWAMVHRKTVIIEDIYRDHRIPHDAYRPTFVKSLCMVPIRSNQPIGAIGTYWAKQHVPSESQVSKLQAMAAIVAVHLIKLQSALP